MNVRRLIELLSKYSPEMLVTSPGYEGGLREVDCCEIVDIALNVNTEWYYGRHEEVIEGTSIDYEGYQRTQAVKIS